MFGFQTIVVSVVNDNPNGMLFMVSFLVLYSTICGYGYVHVHQQVGQSNTMKAHTQTLTSAIHIFALYSSINT